MVSEREKPPTHPVNCLEMGKKTNKHKKKPCQNSRKTLERGEVTGRCCRNLPPTKNTGGKTSPNLLC